MRASLASLALVVGVSALALITLSARVFGGGIAPDFEGGGPWFNTNGQPLILSTLHSKVVAVEMWTAGCENCLNVLPHLRQWNARYRDRGLVVVGVHTPEFAHERSVRYVQDAITRLSITYPVVMDNDYRIWNAYHNNYWPALYLIDKKGNIRYTHIGEGEYDTTERMIKQLLAESS